MQDGRDAAIEREADTVNLTLLIGVACAILFFRAARYERMSPWAWSLASVGVSAILGMRASGVTVMLVGQVALFALMWWYNVRRQGRRQG